VPLPEVPRELAVAVPTEQLPKEARAEEAAKPEA
jgi:hypothetical protein